MLERKKKKKKIFQVKLVVLPRALSAPRFPPEGDQSLQDRQFPGRTYSL